MGADAAASASRPLLGRDDDLTALTDALNLVSSGGARLLLIEGEPGIGKTRLLDEAVARAGTRSLVLRGAAHELERERPFGIIADALGLRPAATDPDCAAIARLIFGEASTGTAASEEFPAMRFRIVEAILGLLERWAQEQRVLLTLEDLHWADPSSVLVLDQIIRRLADHPVAVLATVRPSPRSSSLEQLHRGLSSDELIVVRLEPLDDDAVRELVAAIVGASPGPGLLSLIAGAAGNPFFVTELIEALLEDGTLQVAAGEADVTEAATASSLRLTILRRLGVLPPGCLQVLRMASVLGSRFSLDDLSVVSATPASDLVQTLEEPRRTGLLVEDGDALAFRHDLVRDAIYHDLPLSAREALHVQVARLLARAGRDPVKVATHFLAGATRGDAEAVKWLDQAARDALSRAPSVAAELLTGALELSGDDAEDRDRLSVDLATALMWAGHLDQAEAVLRDLVRRPSHPEVDVQIRLALARVLLIQGKAVNAVEHCDALARSADLPGWPRARGLTDAAMVRLFSGDVDGAKRDAEEALAQGRLLGDDPAVCGALNVLSWVANLRGRTTEALELGEQAVALAEESPLWETRRRYPHCYLGVVLMDADRLDDGRRMFDTGRRMGEALGDAWTLPIHHWGAMLADLYAGRYEDAATALETATQITAEVGTDILAVWIRAVAAHIAIQRDDLAEAERKIAEGERMVEADGPGVGFDWLLWTRALLHEAEGDAAAAARTLRTAWDLADSLGIVSQRRLIAPDLVGILLQAGDRATAREVAQAMEQAAHLSGVASARGVALRCRGLAEEDPEVLLGAVAAYRDGPRRMDLARACEEASGVLARDGRDAEARELLIEAVGLYHGCGAIRAERRADAGLRKLGVSRGRREPRARPATGWDALTPTEVEVTRLAAEGLTNPQIGSRLFISHRTVETHLSHVFAKLGVSSRVELAAEAVRRAR